MSGKWAGISRIRVVIGAAGSLITAFGAFRLLSEIPSSDLIALAGWLVGALILHDAVLSPGLVGVGAGLRKLPPRARTYVQGALVAGGIVTVVAIPMIYRAGSQPKVKAILDQDFRTNLAVLLAIITAATLLTYLHRVLHERSTAGPVSPDDDHLPENPIPTAEDPIRPSGG